jgi:hypothetical protein
LYGRNSFTIYVFSGIQFGPKCPQAGFEYEELKGNQKTTTVRVGYLGQEPQATAKKPGKPTSSYGNLLLFFGKVIPTGAIKKPILDVLNRF